MRAANPPRLASWLLERFGTASRLHSLVGDLTEEYANGRSRMWYWQQALGTVALDFARALRTHSFSLRRGRTRAVALAWLGRLRRGLRAEEGSELLEWLQRRSHRACIARVAAERDSPEALALLSEIFLVNPEWVNPPQGRSLTINVVAALAATFMAALPLVYTHHYVPGLILGPALEGSFTETMGTVYTSDGRTMRRVVLEDGTRVVLNRGTRMVVLFSKNWRTVLLTRGEATFTVAQHALRPFELTADGHPIRTLAATFDIHLTGRDAMELTVLEGALTVFRSQASATVLKARQTLYTKPGTQSVRTLSELEAQARIAWQHG